MCGIDFSILYFVLILPDHDGVTALLHAVKNSHVEVVRVLLDKGLSLLLVASDNSHS